MCIRPIDFKARRNARVGVIMIKIGMIIGERYEILEKIGTGGMSDVYKAKCHKLNRFVAIKVLKNEFSQDKTFVTKFRAEAQSAAGLTHPNIVSVYEVGDEDGIYYIVMELVEGITLKKYIEKRLLSSRIRAKYSYLFYFTYLLVVFFL